MNALECEINLHVATFDPSTSFNLHHASYKDTHLKYIQFRTLHKCFYTNQKLFKMGIKKPPLCALCSLTNYSVEHVVINCPISKALWLSVQDWIIELGVPDYNITYVKIVTGELEKSICINSIIILTKKVIYNAMRKEKNSLTYMY